MDSEIPDLLRQLQNTDKQEKAYDELQRYRAEALTLAVLYADQERDEKIKEAQEALTARLRKLLG